MHLGAEATVLERLFSYDLFAILQFSSFSKLKVQHASSLLGTLKGTCYCCDKNLEMLYNPVTLFCLLQVVDLSSKSTNDFVAAFTSYQILHILY